MLSMAVTQSISDGNTLCSVFPVLWMTSCFHIIEQIGRIRHDAYVSPSSPGGDAECGEGGGKSAVSDCVLSYGLHLKTLSASSDSRDQPHAPHTSQ